MPKIKEDVCHSIEIKKSKFITYLHRSSDEMEARDFLRRVKKEHPQANHHCTAMIINGRMHSSDDGEPSQTAGRPMLDVLVHKEMEDVFAVVVRYFGGTKLGTGGLVRAYSSSVQQALEQAVLTQTETVSLWQITFPYDLFGRLDGYFRSHGIEVTETDYQEDVTLTFLSKEDRSSDLLELSNGTLQPQWLKDVEIEQAI